LLQVILNTEKNIRTCQLSPNLNNNTVFIKINSIKVNEVKS